NVLACNCRCHVNISEWFCWLTYRALPSGESDERRKGCRAVLWGQRRTPPAATVVFHPELERPLVVLESDVHRLGLLHRRERAFQVLRPVAENDVAGVTDGLRELGENDRATKQQFRFAFAGGRLPNDRAASTDCLIHQHELRQGIVVGKPDGISVA